MVRAASFAGTSLVALCMACSPAPAASPVADPAGIDSLNARLVQAYRDRDAQRYAEQFTDSAIFEWPAFNKVRGRVALEAMVRGNWATLRDLELQLTVANRRIGASQATEFGAFRITYRDSAGKAMAEYGRYVHALTRQPAGGWLLDRFLGFADSTIDASARRTRTP
jgi:ketosteroid isomerase-like protein